MPSKHTPPPWTFVYGERMYSDNGRILATEAEVVAIIPDDETIEIEDGAIAECLSPKAKANGRLLAQAPSMAEAMAGAADEFDRWLATRKMVAITKAGIIQLRDEFRAILDRAGIKK